VTANPRSTGKWAASPPQRLSASCWPRIHRRGLRGESETAILATGGKVLPGSRTRFRGAHTGQRWPSRSSRGRRTADVKRPRQCAITQKSPTPFQGEAPASIAIVTTRLCRSKEVITPFPFAWCRSAWLVPIMNFGIAPHGSSSLAPGKEGELRKAWRIQPREDAKKQ
jgi:hypothetical protein